MTDMDKIYEPLAIEDQPPYPIEASEWGKNSLYHECEIVQQRKNVAICMQLNRIVARGDKVRIEYEPCKQAILTRACPAIRMREEEEAAGEALYYQPRRKVKMTQTTTRLDRPAASSSLISDETRHKREEQLDARVSGRHVPKQKPASKSKPEQPIQMDMSKMLNDMMKKETRPEPKPVEKSAVIVRQPGESPLAFARRKMAANP